MNRALALFAGAFLCLVLLPAAALAQQATIAGVVKDTSGAVLPGVTVEIASPALIEKTRTAVSDGSGQYQIIQLVPGTYSVTFTPSSTDLPQGWGGYGAEDPVTFEPILPPGVTYADVMASTDELAFTTYEPGWFFGFTVFDVRYDNVFVDRAVADDTLFVDGFDPVP